MKKSWIHQARKSDNYSWDYKEKDKVNWILREHFGFAGVFDEPVGTREDHRFPDIYVRHRCLVIELDGEYHGSGDDISTSAKDSGRYEWFRQHGFKLIVINKEATDGYDEQKIIDRLVAKGLKLCHH
jgi:very-short-patch-repair endonuclease